MKKLIYKTTKHLKQESEEGTAVDSESFPNSQTLI